LENTFNHIDELIGKYLAGEANTTEKETVDTWLVEHEGNKKYFEQFEVIFNRASTIKEWQQYDTDAAWAKLKTKLKESNGKVIPIRKPSGFNLYWKVAAAVTLIMVVGYLIYNQFEKTPVQTFAIQSQGQTVQDTLPDGSTAFLNKSSSLNFTYDSKEKIRTVKLTGEAFFDVKHEAEKPFKIESEDVIIEDIGTTFNVKAYPESDVVEVFVESGEVAFYTKSNAGLKLTAGETGTYDKLTKSFTRIEVADTNVLAYKTRVFSFYNTDLGTVVENLNEVYETKIQLRGKLKSCRLNVTFKGEPIETIAEIIAETLDLKMTVLGKEILLEGIGCEE
jgi:ferric-dicitrate binding protein FerR (iron transport regulator)